MFLFKNLSIALTLMNIRFPTLEKGMSLLAILDSIHLRDTPRYSCACFLLSQPCLVVSIGHGHDDGGDDEYFTQP